MILPCSLFCVCRTHCQFNSSEVGQKLAATLLSKLDPTVDVSDASDDNGLLPRFTKPKVVHATLPGEPAETLTVYL